MKERVIPHEGHGDRGQAKLPANRSRRGMVPPLQFFATCAKGTEGALRRELAALRLPAVTGARGGVSFEGRLEHGMRACLHSRSAMRVLLQLGSFPAADAG